MQNRYLYLRNRKNFPVACIATRVNHDSKKMEYGYSVYNPNDQFNKSVAREEADKKIEEKGFFTSWDQNLSAHKNTELVLKDLLSKSEIPLQLKVVAKKWLKKIK